MIRVSKSRLLAGSAAVGICAFAGAAPAFGQEVGIRNDQPILLEITVQDGEVVEGTQIGVYAEEGPIDLTVETGGTVRGNGTNPGDTDIRADAGVAIAQPDSIVSNSGSISGAAHGITTVGYFGTDAEGNPLPVQGLATGTTVINNADGSIIGEGGHGVALVGGGSVTNAGYIRGTGLQVSGTILDNSTGVVIAAFPDQEPVDGGVGSIVNLSGGVIEGGVYGVLLSGGGAITNAGTIRSLNQQAAPGTAPFGIIVSATADQENRIATVDNSGTVTGAIGFLATGNLASATLTNSGSVGGQAAGIFNQLTGGGTLTINNQSGGTILGQGYAIRSVAGDLAINNADGATISSPSSAIEITSGSASIVNAGTIDGGNYGIHTQLTQNPETLAMEALAAGAAIENSGTITGRNNDGIRLEGGGSVVNSGTIEGLVGAQTDGISMFPGPVQPNEEYSASVVNAASGAISGDRYGVILTGGGTIDNAGAIAGNVGGVRVQGIASNSMEGEDRAGVIGIVTNSGTILGLGAADLGGHAVTFGSDLGEAALVNSGEVTSLNGYGVFQGSLSDLTVQNGADGVIEGGTSGIYAGSSGTIAVENAGTIRGNGVYDGFDATPDAGITIATAGSSVVNSGSITGAGAGITTAYLFDSTTGALLGLATGTTVSNSGLIAGESNDGVRLIGGGIVENSGFIFGTGNAGADGVSMFRYDDQTGENYSASVVNSVDGSIGGDRFGVALSGGGTVENAGEIFGSLRGVQIQSQGEEAGQIGSVVNSGLIEGAGEGGVTFAGALDQAALENTGTIAGGDRGVVIAIRGDSAMVNEGEVEGGTRAGVWQDSGGNLALVNASGGTITGATSGIYAGGGSITIDNAGTIRGNGNYDGFDAEPDAGITIATASSSVTNSGTISGAGAGITTAYVFDPASATLLGLATGTNVSNSGTISGEGNDGVRLIGGGLVENSGTISGAGRVDADGVSMFRYDDQTGAEYAASVVNSEDGTIAGDRYGIALSGGGSVENAGLVAGASRGIQLQSQGEEAGQAGSIVNTGVIVGDTDAGVVFAGALDTVALVNSGLIAGTQRGLVIAVRGTANIDNSGVIDGGDGLAILTSIDTGAINLVNSGALVGGVTLSAFDDTVTLRTDSLVTGGIDGLGGSDSLVLEGTILELTEAQVLGAAANFETLAVASGYWSTDGFVGAFNEVTIAEGAALQVNETALADEATSPIETGTVALDGSLILNFSEDESVSALDALSITGTGNLQLIGEAVFTLDSETIAHTGGTLVANGGLILTGTLDGDVATSGDGYFQLGTGGTEGSFAGSIVNDGRFVFNRSDDYDFGGDFSGTGTLDKLGDGVLTFLGNYAFSGVTNIFAGAVRIGGIIDPETDFNLGEGGTLDITGQDQTIGGLEGQSEAQVELGEQRLTIEQEENTTFAGIIAGSGGITKSGPGLLNLTGDNTYTGLTEVNGGKLAVNGSIVSPVTVTDGGALGGNGTVGNTQIGTAGTLAPGNSIGRLTVAGDLALAAGSIYEIEVNAAGEGDRVDATGLVTIASTAAVSVLAAAGNYAPRTDYIILTGAQGVTGTFGSVTTDLAFLDPLLRYGANAVTLSLYRNDIAFADVAVNTNQAAVAAAVQALGIDNPLFETVLLQNAATAQATFGDLSGEILASTVTGLTDDSRHLRGALLSMPRPAEAGTFVWGSGFGAWGDFDATNRAFGMETDHKGLVAGIGYGGQGFAAALSAGIGGSDFDLDGRNDRADVESKFLALHGSTGTPVGLHGTAGLSYAWHDIDTIRGVSGTAIGQTLTSNRDADTVQLFGELGYGIASGSALFTPFARIAHVSTDSEGFTEAGGSAALITEAFDQSTTFLSLGGEARFNATGAGFQPYLSAAWNRAFGDRRAFASSQFASGGPDFAVAGVAIPKDSAELEAGFVYETGAFSLGGAYAGTLAGDRSTHGARITATFAF